MAREKVKKLKNPFVFKGYEGPEYFCDRTEETEILVSGLQSGMNITLISPRKIGKTGLIKHVFHQILQKNKDAVCLYVDIFATQSRHEFVSLFCKSFVEEVVEREKSLFAKALDSFRGWRPVFSADPMTGALQVSVSIDLQHTDNTLKSIFEYIERLDKEVYIAIDEFQQVAGYAEKGTEALLRSYIQFSHAHFIFAGSKQHLMSEMFLSPKRPFYNSTQIVNLDPLHEEVYFSFARHFFETRKGGFDEKAFHSLYNLFDGVTWNIQMVLHRLYDTYTTVENEQQVLLAVDTVVKLMSVSFESMQPLLTQVQADLLKAIAKDEPVAKPLNGEFIKHYDLSSPSTIKSALETLQNKELVYRNSQGYIIYDRFFSLWLKRIL
ncbi:MAG: ATP-binding protein [Prevotella sp.]|nr:ATP-binding protein [Prevotella sp.]